MGEGRDGGSDKSTGIYLVLSWPFSRMLTGGIMVVCLRGRAGNELESRGKQRPDWSSTRSLLCWTAREGRQGEDGETKESSMGKDCGTRPFQPTTSSMIPHGKRSPSLHGPSNCSPSG